MAILDEETGSNAVVYRQGKMKQRKETRLCKRQSIHWGIMMEKERDVKRRSKEANTYPPRIDRGDGWT